MNNMIFIVLFFPVFIFSQDTFDELGNIISHKSFNDNGDLKIIYNYFYKNNRLVSEEWQNKDGVLFVSYDYNKYDLVSKITKYSTNSSKREILDYENYFYDEKENLKFSLYTDSNGDITEEVFNSREDKVHTIYHQSPNSIKEIIKKKNEEKFSTNKFITILHKNGLIKEEGYFERSFKEGYWVYYYDNGNYLSEGLYYMGEKNEEWKEYNNNGELTRISQWYDGNLIKVKCIDKYKNTIKCVD